MLPFGETSHNFVVWSQRELPVDHAMGMTIGNTVLMRGNLEGTVEGEYILHHELNHVRQFQALGWLFYPARMVFPLETTSGGRLNVGS